MSQEMVRIYDHKASVRPGTAPIEISSMTSNSSFFNHTIRGQQTTAAACMRFVETETLAQIAHRYGATPALLRRINKLSSDEIWYRKTIQIPKFVAEVNQRTKTPPDPAIEKARIKSNQESMSVSAMSKISDLPIDVIRYIFLKCDWNFTRALNINLWILETRKRFHFDLDVKELLAYLEMTEFHLDKAEDLLERDLLWEKRIRISPPPPTLISPRTRGRVNHFQDNRRAASVDDRNSSLIRLQHSSAFSHNRVRLRKRRLSDYTDAPPKNNGWVELGKKAA